MDKYFITEYDINNINKFVLDLLTTKLLINPNKINSYMTKKAYDSSDYIAWVLLYENDREQLKIDREILNNVFFGEEESNNKVFSVSGNGYGTGISLMFNLKIY